MFGQLTGSKNTLKHLDGAEAKQIFFPNFVILANSYANFSSALFTGWRPIHATCHDEREKKIYYFSNLENVLFYYILRVKSTGFVRDHSWTKRYFFHGIIVESKLAIHLDTSSCSKIEWELMIVKDVTAWVFSACGSSDCFVIWHTVSWYRKKIIQNLLF